MNTSLLFILLESSVYLLGFISIYYLFIDNLTHFKWMRFYLLSSLALSVCLPFVKIDLLPVWISSVTNLTVLNQPLTNYESGFAFYPDNIVNNPTQTKTDLWTVILTVLTIVYSVGVLYKAFKLYNGLQKIVNFVKSGNKVKEGRFWIISNNYKIPAFSFFHYIFISTALQTLNIKEQTQIKQHEITHAKQLHTIDNLLVELVSILLWFNPFMKYLKSKINEVHEYLADESIAFTSTEKQKYSNLLLNLSCKNNHVSFSSGFTSKQIGRRILMIAKKRSLAKHKFLFALIIPIAVSILMSFSFIHRSDNGVSNQKTPTVIQSSEVIGSISWNGNTLLTNKELDKLLNIKSGDIYDKELFEKRLYVDDDCVCNYFMNRGYMFYNIKMEEHKNNDIINISLQVFEGNTIHVGKVIFSGNTKINSKELKKEISIKENDLFNKSKLISSIQILSKMGVFKEDSIAPTLLPIIEESKVDISFQLTEK